MRTVRRLLLVAVVLALVSAGAALAARGDPQKRFNPADQARARAMLLRQSDFGPGFRTVPPSGTGDVDYYCSALDESDLTLTGEAKSNGFVASFQSYGSASQIYATVADATASWRRGTSAAGVRCLTDAFRKAGLSQGVRFVSYRKVPFPSVAPRTVAYRWVSSANGVRIYGDFVVLMRSRAHVALYFVAPVGPVEKSDQAELARTLAARMARAMRGA
jgi:hypothetical protein